MSRLKKAGRELAAQLVAEGRLTDEKIAERLGCVRQTLAVLKRKPEFKQHVAEIVAKLAEESLKFNIARREGRIAVQQELEAKLLTIIEERAREAQATNNKIPGMRTGLVCKTLKGIGKGEDFQVVEVYEADTPTVKALLALHEQAAKEMGQFEEAELKVRANLADVIADARKRAAEAKSYAKALPSVTNSQKDTQKLVN